MATAADKVFSEIAAGIFSGVLRPRDVISERDLVARFGVSRTPVREAIKRLLERGFLEVGPKGAAVVVDLTHEDLRKLYDLRVRLEDYCAKLTAANITAEEIEELRKINKQFAKAIAERDLVQMLEVRAKFHAKAVQAARNKWLAEILIMLRDRAYAVRHYHWQDVSRAAQTTAVHEQMIAALSKGDTPTYRRLVTEQIRTGLDWYMGQLRPHSPIHKKRTNRLPHGRQSAAE